MIEDKCKFCEYEGTGFTQCENGYDQETYEPYYCGNLECPMCFSCQGNDVTTERVEACMKTRKITENWRTPAYFADLKEKFL